MGDTGPTRVLYRLMSPSSKLCRCSNFTMGTLAVVMGRMFFRPRDTKSVFMTRNKEIPRYCSLSILPCYINYNNPDNDVLFKKNIYQEVTCKILKQ